jgi:hypothetical protein
MPEDGRSPAKYLSQAVTAATLRIIQRMIGHIRC